MRVTAVLIVVAILAAGVALFARDNPLVTRAQGYAETVATNAAATYVTLRTLNAFLSTAQEVEVGGSLFVSGNVQPLKVLEPIDDTVERVAGAIFVVMAATGLLAVALGPVGVGGWVLVALACAIALIERGVGRSPGVSRPLLIYGGFLALALPLAFVLAATVADAMTDAVWLRHQAIIAEITRGIAEVAETGTGEEEGGWIVTLIEPLGSIGEYRDFATGVYGRADELVASFVMILAVFLFKIFVLPLLVLGGFFVAARHLARRATP